MIETNNKIVEIMNNIGEIVLNMLDNIDTLPLLKCDERGLSNWFKLTESKDEKLEKIANKIYDFTESLIMGDHVSLEDNDNMSSNVPIKKLEFKIREYYTLKYIESLSENNNISDFDKEILKRIEEFRNWGELKW